MAWYFHIVELDNGLWTCRHGNTEYDQHSDLAQAIEHMRRLARENGPASIRVHRRNGAIDHIHESEVDR